MTATLLSRSKNTILLLFITLFVVFIYTFLHEGGHAIVAIFSGGAIHAFNVNFFNLSAHVGLDGQFSTAQLTAINLVGAALPVLTWLAFLLATPRKGSLVIEALKTVASLVVLNTLLAWIVLPLLALSGKAPADDVTSFIAHAGVGPIWISLTALILYIGGWALYLTRIDGLRSEINLFIRPRPEGNDPRVRLTLLWLGGIFTLCALIAFSANGFRLFSPSRDQYQPPLGYALINSIDLSQAEHNEEALYTFRVDKQQSVGIYLLVEHINTPYIEVRIDGPGEYSKVIVHGEGYSTARDNPYIEEQLPAGQYKLILTSKPSPGKLSVYTRENR